MKQQYIRAKIEGGFWRAYQKLVRDRVVPYQWKAMNDEIPGAEKSHSIENFRIAAGLSTGKHEGMVFQDTDLYKWLEAVGNLPAGTGEENGALKAWVDEAVRVISAAQQPDGYLNTYFIVNEPHKRWMNLRDAHELYCAGHLIEAAVSLARGGWNDELLEVARRLADLIEATFGTGEGKLRGYPGHEELELALMKLYHHSGEPRYLELARYFVDERGRTPNYFESERESPSSRPRFDARTLEYHQAHLPVREQQEAVGHAVRAMYLYIAMADLALESGDPPLVAACDRLWENTTQRKMYVTGGIGSSWVQESFGAEFDLPNDTAYAETCAAIGLFLFSSRMLRLHDDARYADVMERCLYNSIISGLALDGESYFYVNPLAVVPRVCDSNPSYRSVKYRRQPWYGCSCCPPNVARTLTGLGDHLYHLRGDTLYADLYHEGVLSFELDGRPVTLRQATDYPWSGGISLTFQMKEPLELDLALRVPEWCSAPRLAVGGSEVRERTGADGYLHLRRLFRDGDRIELELPMEVVRVHADRRVAADSGRVAVQRGPLVYCLEEADNGTELFAVRLPEEAAIEVVAKPALLGGLRALSATGVVDSGSGDGREGLYSAAGKATKPVAKPLLFVPYFAWANRSPGEMIVWVRE